MQDSMTFFDSEAEFNIFEPRLNGTDLLCKVVELSMHLIFKKKTNSEIVSTPKVGVFNVELCDTCF